MKTNATVLLVHNDNGMVAVETATNDVTLIELLGCEVVRPGDLLSGYWDELDNQTVYNESRDEQLAVFIHECGGDLDTVRQRYFSAPTEAPQVALDVAG